LNNNFFNKTANLTITGNNFENKIFDFKHGIKKGIK